MDDARSAADVDEMVTTIRPVVFDGFVRALGVRARRRRESFIRVFP
ncbi:MAG TPA: hypothetical protein VGM40_12685 [Mycobacterium sp.]